MTVNIYIESFNKYIFRIDYYRYFTNFIQILSIFQYIKKKSLQIIYELVCELYDLTKIAFAFYDLK